MPQKSPAPGILALGLLCAAGCLAEVDAGVASLESAFGGALPGYRRAVEAGLVRVREFS